MSGHRGRVGAALAAAALCLLCVAAVSAPASVSASRAVRAGAAARSQLIAPVRTMLAASRPSRLPGARFTRATPADHAVSFGVVLKLRHLKRAQGHVGLVSDPAGDAYGRYLTHRQFARGYLPGRREVDAVTSWLRSQRLRVTATIAAGMYLRVRGASAAVGKTFGTELRDFDYQGRTLHANTRPLSLAADTPAAVTSAVAGVIGLDQGSALKRPSSSTLPGPAAGARSGVAPCSAYYAQKIATTKPAAYHAKQPYAVCGYSPHQYQGAYGESRLLGYGIDGRGTTIAVTGAYASPTIVRDARHYSRMHRTTPLRPRQYREIRPATFAVHNVKVAQSWYGEQTLDVEAAHAMAPGAKIVYVAGSDDVSGLDEAWAQAIDTHVADIVTDSWSYNTDAVDATTAAFYNQFAVEAALTGITVEFASGDVGDHTSGGSRPAARAVGFPSDNPYVTSVGGTSVLIGSRSNWLGEYGWSNAYSMLWNGRYADALPGVYNSGGGGGTSTLYPQPAYQKGKVPAALATANGAAAMRVVPDISMAGDPNTGFLEGQTQRFPRATRYAEHRVGGTSLSAPLLAGMLALVDQVAGHSVGFANPLYYRLLGKGALHDLARPARPLAQVRTGFVNGVNTGAGRYYVLQTIDTLGGTLVDRRGYDNETGVGSPAGTKFFLGMAFRGNTRGGLAKLRHTVR